MKTMKRKQFHLTEVEEDILKKIAKQKGVSEAEVVRKAIVEYANQTLPKKNPLLEVAEKAQTYKTQTKGDLSVKHDQHLEEIYDNE